MDLPWMHALPKTWSMRPLRAIADYVVSNVDKVPADDEVPVRLCNYTDVYNNEFITLGLTFMQSTATNAEIEKFGLAVGDVIITKDSESWDDIGVPALVRETASDLVCGYHLALLRPRPEAIDGRFLFRCLQAKPVRVQLELAANGVTRFGIPKSDIGTIVLPVPPTPQQHAIADYLDRETARIDALIAAKERLLALLAEKRRALITRAVTRGLDPHAPIRDSAAVAGGDEVNAPKKRLKYLATINDEALGEDTAADFEMQYVDISNVDSSGNFGEIATYRFEDAPSRARRRVQDGDVIISTVRTYLQAIAPIRKPPANLVVSTGFAVVRPRAGLLDAQYCKYAIRDPEFLAEVERRSVGVSYPAINASDLANIPVHIHELSRQRAIADYLDRETTKLDGLRTAVERTITLLKERRSALIAAAVTGQIDVEAAA